ncbi:MAG: MlaD family protein [Nitrospirota bacterium]|nr:MlaD family protein [Nitrospirota bacterium]
MREEVKAGLIIVVSMLLLTALIILIGGSQFLDKYDTYYIRVKNAAGLETGAQVKLGGVRVGRVVSVKEPQQAGESVLVEIGIKQGKPIYKGTKASVTQVGFVGDIYLLLSVNDTVNERIKVGDLIPSEEVVDFGIIMAKVEGLSKSLDNLIQDVNKIFSPQNIKQVESLLGSSNKAIVSATSNIDKMTADIRTTTDKLSKVLDELEGLVSNNKGEFAQVLKKGHEALDKAEGMFKSIEKSSKTVDRAIDHQSQNLDALLNTMTRTTDELQDLIHEIKSKPWSILYKEGKGE